MLLRKLFIIVIITLLAFTFTQLSFADEGAEIRAFIDDTAGRVLQVLQSNSDGNIKGILQKRLTAIFHEVVDIDWMARYALGKNWRNFNSSQKDSSSKHAEYLNAYRTYLTNSYVRKFTKYNGHKYKIISVKYLKDGDFIVSTKIFPADDEGMHDAVDVSYRLKKYNNIPRYKIIDIIGEGVSLLAVQRSDFNAVVAKHGMDGLISMLSGKNGINK